MASPADRRLGSSRREGCDETSSQPRPQIPRGIFIGRVCDRRAATDAPHFLRCPECGGWIDCRDLGHVADHLGPLPHPPEDQPQ